MINHLASDVKRASGILQAIIEKYPAYKGAGIFREIEAHH